MGHREKHRNTTPTSKNVITSMEPITISGTPPEIVISKEQEEKVRVLKGIERSMEDFRAGKRTQFQTLANITDKLDKWSTATDEDREHALSTYLAELNSIPFNLTGNESSSITQPSGMSFPSSDLQK